jgi:SpoVK/Ycf46/Vps4 family AAA+-type ATPase
MFKVHLGDTPHTLTERDFQALGAGTEGFSGSDVAVVVKDVLMQPIRLLREATHFRKASGRGQALRPDAGVAPRRRPQAEPVCVCRGSVRRPCRAPPHPPPGPPRPAARQVRHPDGGEGYEPCAPGAPGAQEVGLQYFADKGLADRVLPPTISRTDFDKARARGCVLADWREGRVLYRSQGWGTRATHPAPPFSDPPDRACPFTCPPARRPQVLLRARPTVSPKDLAQYEKFTDEFGEEAS